MVSDIVLRKNYRGYELIVRKLSFEIWVRTSSWLQQNNDYYCGYVVIPEESPFYGMDYGDLEDCICVHGGLTYSGMIDGIDGYLIGFDCGHGGDNPYIQDEKYTLKECESLVDQIIELEKLLQKIGMKDKAEMKTYRHEIHCEIDITDGMGAETIKKLKEEYESLFPRLYRNLYRIVNEDGEVEDEN